MVTLEQIKLLESKIARAIDFVGQLTEENVRLKKRNDELEDTIAKLKEEKNKVEEGIISALGRLNQFEDAIERSLSSVTNRIKSPPIQANPSETGIPVQEPARTYHPIQPPVPPPVSSAYTVEEEELEEEAEDPSEAELDIF